MLCPPQINSTPVPRLARQCHAPPPRPRPGKVESAQSDGQGDRCSLSLLDAQSLEESGEKLEDMGINALWLDGEGGGSGHCPPS